LTINQNYADVGPGDRMLANWQGQGYYHFATIGTAQNVNYPDDIEGLWTYLYYSYSVNVKRCVGFIKYGTADVQRT
jgi:hypothetical protein